VVEPAPDAKPLRVLILIDRLPMAGGAERFARELALRLDPARFRRTVCVTRWSDTKNLSPEAAGGFEALRAAGVEILGMSRDSRLALGAWRPLLGVLRERVDILHSHMFGSNVWASVLGTIAQTPVIVAHEQTWSYEGQPLRRLLDGKLIGRQADAFICVSREDRRRMIEVEGIDPGKIVLVPNAIPSPEPRKRSDLRSELGLDDDVPVIGAVCVLRPQKALDVLLRAVPLVRDEFPRARLVIVGGGPERERLESLAAEIGVEDATEFLGQRTDAAELVFGFDVAVLSSDFEGTPLAVMEYMAAARPIVATAVGGVPEMLEDGEHGLLVPPQDPEALARAIAGLLRDRTAADELGRRAQERQRREFDIEAAVRRIEALYEDLYAASPRADPARLR
jgi:glycosyltransferase involved in cell wall biosynthesis